MTESPLRDPEGGGIGSSIEGKGKRTGGQILDSGKICFDGSALGDTPGPVPITSAMEVLPGRVEKRAKAWA